MKFGAEGRYLRCPFCVRRGGAMKPTVLWADTTFFLQHNPEFHEFLSKYAHEPRVKAAKLQSKKPPRISVKDLKKKKKRKGTAKKPQSTC